MSADGNRGNSSAAGRDPDSVLKQLIERVEEAKKIVADLERDHAHWLANPAPKAAAAATDPPAAAASSLPTETPGAKKRREEKVLPEVARTAADIEHLRASCPDDCVPVPAADNEDADNDAQYFLAVAELQENNAILRSQLELGRKNLQILESDAEVYDEWTANFDQFSKTLADVKAKKAAAAATAAASAGQAATATVDPFAAKLQELDGKIRSTNVTYKRIKAFLGKLLPILAPNEESGNSDDDDSQLAKILQELWNTFHDDPEEWTDLADLDFDVHAMVIDELRKTGIVDVKDGDKPDVKLVKMVDFTR